MPVEIERAHAATPEVQELVGELERTLVKHYADDQRHGLSVDRLFAPGVRFFIARVDGAAVGCGGLALVPGCAEVKRMYTRPALRGRGVAMALLERIEAEARAAGAAALLLETGVFQQEAIRLYERNGFRRRGPFGHYAEMPARATELSLFYEKPL